MTAFIITERVEYRVVAESEQEAEDLFVAHGPDGPPIEFIAVTERDVVEA